MSSKVSALTALSSVQADDLLAVVDVHDTSMASSGTDKKMTLSQLPFARLLTPVAVKTSAYGAAAGDYVPCDTTGAGFTVTLPAAPADLTVIGVKMVIQGGTNTVTIACAGSDVFNKAGGGTSLTLTLLNQGVLLQYKASGAIWYVLADDLALSQLDARFIASAVPVPLAQGGTGQTTQQAAIDVLAGAVTSGQYLRGNGTHVVLAAIQAADVPTLNQSTTGNAATATNLAGGATLPAYVAPKVVTLTQSGGAVAVNAALGNVFRLVLTASGWTLSNPTGFTDGEPIRVRLIQDGTGSRTISYGSAWDFGASGPPTLSTGANKVDYLVGEWSADANAGAGAVVVSAALGY